jgi:hypothetical protein
MHIAARVLGEILIITRPEMQNTIAALHDEVIAIIGDCLKTEFFLIKAFGLVDIERGQNGNCARKLDTHGLSSSY